MRTVYGDHQRYETTYFKKFPGYYCTGDGAKMDKVSFIFYITIYIEFFFLTPLSLPCD